MVQIGSLFTLVLGFFKIFKSFSVKKLDAARSDGEESITDRHSHAVVRGFVFFAVIGGDLNFAVVEEYLDVAVVGENLTFSVVQVYLVLSAWRPLLCCNTRVT